MHFIDFIFLKVMFSENIYLGNVLGCSVYNIFHKGMADLGLGKPAGWAGGVRHERRMETRCGPERTAEIPAPGGPSGLSLSH